MPAVQDLIELSGPYHRILPVRIVQLDLDKLDFGMRVQQLFKVFGAAVEGELLAGESRLTPPRVNRGA